MKCQFLFRFALALFLVMGSRASLAQEEIFVTNTSSVTVYTRTWTGTANMAPLRTITGTNTGLSGVGGGLAVDRVNNELFVVNAALPYSVRVFARTANGNVAPLRTISGLLTGLNNPRGLAVDVVNNELAVANRAGNTVTVFALTATGDVAPLRTITGPGTGLSNPTGVAIDVVNNELVVANNGGSLTVYARTANGNAIPLRKISGALTGFNQGPIGVAVDTVNNELAVTNPFFGTTFQPSVLVFARTADGDVAPLRAIFGNSTGLFNPIGLAVDPVNNELLVPNFSTVTVYLRTANGNGPALRTLQGAGTLLNSPQFLVVTTGGPLVAVQSRKTHGLLGAFDVAIDTAQAIGGAVTVEPRNIGTGHTIVFQFNTGITATGTVSSTAGSASAAISGNDVVVTLTGIPDNSRATVSLTNVNNAGVNASASIGFLVGDVNNSRSVTATDILQVKGRSGQATDGTNFKFDLNASGSVTATDILAVKGRSGLVLP